MNPNTRISPSYKTQVGDLVQLIGPRDKSFIFILKEEAKLHTHVGILEHDQIIGIDWGKRVQSHLNRSFLVMKPALDDLIRGINRATQIVYPKDIGYILVSMGIGPGKHVVEAGTGSGALTIAFAYAVGSMGRVTSYEKRPEAIEVARSNLELVGMSERVTLIERDIADGFNGHDADALFLDLPNPQDYINQVREAISPGGFFGCLLPTTNQVTRLLHALKISKFTNIEVSELLHRYYKPIATKLRPVDRMTAHTGYLIFARPISSPQTDDPTTTDLTSVETHE
jgi:tRNA (adenine57-N1/adenine58-N1)-methyltransferase